MHRFPPYEATKSYPYNYMAHQYLNGRSPWAKSALSMTHQLMASFLIPILFIIQGMLSRNKLFINGFEFLNY